MSHYQFGEVLAAGEVSDMSFHRIERVNSLMRHELSELLQREVKDPRLSSSVIVTGVETAPDMRHARVFVSHIVKAEEEKRETLEALDSAAGFLRRELAEKLRLRHIPDLTFEWDDSIERGAHLLELIDKVSEESKKKEKGKEETR
jgi:ribosome-binding factor A